MSETQNTMQLQRKLGARHLNMIAIVDQLVQVYSWPQVRLLPTLDQAVHYLPMY